MIYFTADLHFGHYNIIKYCDRPFRSERHMDQELTRLWNETVTEEDTIYVLGDLSMVTSEGTNYLRRIVSKLNGTKHLILGNHDNLKPFSYVEMGFQTVHTALELKIDNEIYFLNHDPVASITNDRHIWLVGHVHTLFSELKNCINVGVDVRGFKPISIDEINSIIVHKSFNEEIVEDK